MCDVLNYNKSQMCNSLKDISPVGTFISCARLVHLALCTTETFNNKKAISYLNTYRVEKTMALACFVRYHLKSTLALDSNSATCE